MLRVHSLPAFSGSGASVRDPGELARAAGYAAGWSAGSQASRTAARQESDALAKQRERTAQEDRDRVDSCLRALDAARSSIAATVEPDVHALTELVLDSAVELAQAMLGQQLSIGADSGRAALRRALQAAVVPPTVVYLNPADAAQLDDQDIPAHLQVVADPGVPRGDARAVHPAGRVEVRLAENLARIRAALGQPA